MSIATSIQAAQQRVASAYTSVSTMGGTLPATQNLSNLPTAIESIPSGGGSRYGCTADNFLGDVNASGVLQTPADTTGDIVFTGVKEISNYGLYNKFYNNTNLTHGVSFSDLTTVSGSSGCSSSFNGCSRLTSADLSSLTTISGGSGCWYMFAGTGLTSIDLSSLTTISGSNGCGYMFDNCRSLTSADLSSLTTISGSNGCSRMFSGTSLTSIDLSSLTTVSGSGGCSNMFSSCVHIQNIYFRSLTSSSFGSSYINQLSDIVRNTGTTTTHTIHFPSNLESTIQGLSGYPLFGGTSGYVVLAYDLPATS